LNERHNPISPREVGGFLLRALFSARPRRRAVISVLFLVHIIMFQLSCADRFVGSSATVSNLPRRIVSLAPSVTETLFAVGAGDRVVGVTMYCNWPAEVCELPKVGQFARFNFEKILALRPDIVVASRDAPSETVAYELDQYGIKTTAVEAKTIDGAIESVRAVGRAVGNETEADELAADMERRVRNLKKRLEGVERVKAIIVFDHEPFIIAGPGTFADDIIELAGGENIAADAYVNYPQYSIERLVIEGPDVIVEAAHGGGYGDSNAKKIMDFWRQWSIIPAVAHNRIAIVDADLVSRPGPRIIDGLEAVAAALHPDLFADGESSR